MQRTPQLDRLPAVLERTGRSRSSFYADVARGVMPPPVRVGQRASAWPAHEIDAIVEARIAGQGEERIRQLVAELVAARQEARQ